MPLLDDAKTALRISPSASAFNGEVQGLIDAAQADMIESGLAETIVKADEPRPLVKLAILTYCKANFGYNNPDADRLKASYDLQVQKLSMIAEYREGGDAVESGS